MRPEGSMPERTGGTGGTTNQPPADPPGSGGGGTGGTTAPGTTVNTAGVAAPMVRRLTREELFFTLEDALGVKLASADLLPRENHGDGLSNDAVGLVVSAEHAQAYVELGTAVTKAIGDLAAFARRISGCTTVTIGDERCETGYVRGLGGRLFRRPPTSEEVNDFRALFTEARAAGLDFTAGATAVLEAMLQAPQFLYRLETERTGQGGTRAVTGHELASRISYFLWSSAPDAELERAAMTGALETPTGLSAQVTRMLAVQPRAQRASARFVRDWLWIDKLEGLTRGDLPPTMAREMIDSAVATIQDTLWIGNKPFAALFDSRSAMLTPALATWIGLKSTGGAIARYDLSAASERAGLLTHPGLLTVMSDSDNGGIVARGLFILERVLCRHSAPPPAGLDTSAFTTHLGPEATERQYSEDRIKTASCGVCHQQFDPLAYPFERFDGIGRYRTKNAYDVPLRAEGQVELDGMVRPYMNAVDFSKLIAASDQLSRCVTEKGLQSALGRLLTPADEPLITSVKSQFQAGGGTFGALFSAVAAQPAFRGLRTE